MAKGRNQRTRKKKQEELEETLIDVVEVRDNVSSFFEDNKAKILGFVGLLLFLVLGFIAYKYMYKAPREAQAYDQMYKAESQFARDSFALALENPGGGFEGFLDIIENYSGTKAANLSKYYAGISYLNLGRYDDAIEYLSSYSASGNVTPLTKHGALGDAYSEKGEFDKAISSYSKAVSAAKNDFLAPYYLNKLAILRKQQGDTSGARAAYQKIKDLYPNSTQGKNIDKYISALQ